MNITVTIPDNALPAWEARLEQFNNGSGQPPVTIDGFIQSYLDEEGSRHIASLEALQRSILASNETFVELGKKLIAASPEKQVAAFKAAEKALK